MHAFLVASGNWFFRTRNWVSPLAFALLVLLTRPAFAFGTRQDVTLLLAGVCVSLAGQGLRAAVIGYAYIKRGGKRKKVYADTLVQGGFFAHCRNPLYVGNYLLLAGLLVSYGSAVALLAGLAFYGYLYLAITLAEEQYLSGKFGDAYADYAARVNRYLPDPRGLGRSLHGMRYDWRKLVRKEYGTPFAYVVTLLLVVLWKAFLAAGHVPVRTMVPAAAVFGVSAMMWGGGTRGQEGRGTGAGLIRRPHVVNS